ncbi:MAG: hypothetical protein KFW21_05220 [Spirochaetota bacterium]|nr:hypothetical protein [Spirochaetota bacterium]
MFCLSPSMFYSQLKPGTFIEYSNEETSLDMIELYSEYHSIINWTQGTIVTEYSIPITYNDLNIGRNIGNLLERLKEKIIQFTIGAVIQIRVSSIFSFNDFFQNNETIRFKVLSILYSLPIENSVVKNSTMFGKVTVPLFGSNSLTESLYQNILYKEVTNYLTKETTSSQYYDTLIIDMIMFPQFKPSLMPKILDHTGEVVYSIETIEPDVLYNQGPIQFVTSITEALKHSMRGSRIAYILPKAVAGNTSSEIILFEEDVLKIFGQQRTLDQLKKGKVILIIPKEANVIK